MEEENEGAQSGPLTVTYLEDDCFRLGDEGGALEFSAGNDLWLHKSLLLPHHRLGHVLVLQRGELGLVFAFSDLLDDAILPILLVLRQLKLELVGVLQRVHLAICFNLLNIV